MRELIDRMVSEARAGGIMVAVHIVSTKVDEHGIPMEYEGRLYDVARKSPMSPGGGVKSAIKGKTAHEVLAKMATNWKRSGFPGAIED